MSLQPDSIGFGRYVDLGIRYASKNAIDVKTLKKIHELKVIDDSVLLLDDIIDNSEKRNGVKSLHLAKGIPYTIVYSELARASGFNFLRSIMKDMKTGVDFQVSVYETISLLFESIFTGEIISLELKESTLSIPEKIKQYFKMVELSTGSHIKYGLEIGQLMANQQPDSKVSEIALQAGIIRQIVDDYNDYFQGHHEPFGDFVSKSNCLPQILFDKHGGNKNYALNMITMKKDEDARSLILNSDVRKDLFGYCCEAHNAIRGIDTDFNESLILTDYSIVA